MEASSYPVPPTRTARMDTTDPAQDIPDTVVRPVSAAVATASPDEPAGGGRVGENGNGKARKVVKTRPAAETPNGAARKDGDGSTKRKPLTAEEVAAAAAEAHKVLQEPRYVSMAEAERRAVEAAKEKRLLSLLQGTGGAEAKGSPPGERDKAGETASSEHPPLLKGRVEKTQREVAPKPRLSGPPVLYLNEPNGGADDTAAEDASQALQRAEVADGAPIGLADRAERAIKRRESAEAKALKLSISTVKALLKGYGIPSGVVPVLPLESCSACDYCVLFSSRASVEKHLPHVVRALCVTGMKVTYTAPAPAATEDKSQHGASTTTTDAATTTTSNAQEVGSEKGSVGSVTEVKRRLRHMYCFSVEVVPVSGDAEVVSVHVALRPGMRTIFFDYYVSHYNRIAAASVAAEGGGSGLNVDKPFPSEAAELTDAQQKRLLYLVLRHLIHEKAAVPRNTAAITLFPSHVDAMRDKIWQDCVGHPPWKLWKFLRGTNEDALAAYFGEETMFYFAWMNHYQRWLAASSVFALATMLLRYVQGDPAATAAAAASAVMTFDVSAAGPAALTAAKALNGTVMNATAATAAAAAFLRADGRKEVVVTDALALPLFILLLIVGSVLCIKMWERRCHTLCMRFRLFQPSVSSGKDEERPEFRGTKGLNPITGTEELQYPSWIRGLIWQPLSWLVIALFTGFTLALMVCFVNLEGYTHVDRETGEAGFAVLHTLRRLSLPGAVFNKTDHPLLGLIPTVVYLCCISGLSILFKSLAGWLTDLENYKYREEYIRALTQKRVVFEFVNSYAKLFFLAMVRQRITDLSTSLRMVFVTAVFMRLLVDTVIPFMKTHRGRVRRHIAGHRTQEEPRAVPANGKGDGAEQEGGGAAVAVCRHGGSADSPLDEFDERLATYEVYTDYVEMAIQFGYIVLFAVAFPLSPLVAFLSNVIEIRSDLFKLCYVVRRPVPRLGLLENHTWVSVFRVMVIASVMTNALLFAVSATPTIARLLPSCFAYRYHTQYVEPETMRVVATPVLIEGRGRYAVFNAVIVEHVVLGIAAFLFWRISAFPRSVKVYLERKRYERLTAMMAASNGNK